MPAPPTFATRQEYVSRLADLDFWRPHVAEVLGHHGLGDGGEPVAGYNPTYPTFVCGEVVVKLFGGSRAWLRGFAAERAAHALVAADATILAPRVLAEGRLYDDGEAPWPYLVTTRVEGVAWREAEPTLEQQRSLAAELGHQVRRVHALRPVGAATPDDCPVPETAVAAAARRSSLPSHLVAQVDAFLDGLHGLGPSHRVFVHGDLCAMHAFVEHGRLSGIIDWGDALVADRHYELIQIHRDTFRCDKALLRVFLEAYGWPIGRDFPRRALGMALWRQAVGLEQHHSMDVFEPVASLFPLADIATLDELAIELFGI